jgi:membrane protein
MLRAFRLPIGWKDLLIRTVREVGADNCLNLAAQLAFYFFLALFPALLFVVALVSFLPVEGLLDALTSTLARVAPGEAVKIVQDQVLTIANGENGGLLTVGMLGTIWSMSSAMGAIISTLNRAYDIQESRPWWKVKLRAIALTLALAVFMVSSTVLVMVGPTIGEAVAAWFYLGPAFTSIWNVLRWPVVFALVTLAVAIIYYYAPDAEQEWIWITPGSVLATLLWLLISIGFRLYVTNFATYNATYGAVGGVIVLLLWFYVSSLAVLVGAELNAEIEHASPYGKDPGEKQPGEKKRIGRLAEREWTERKRAGTLKPAIMLANCDVDADLPPARPASPPARPMRPTDWVLGGLVLGERALVTLAKLRSRFRSSDRASNV